MSQTDSMSSHLRTLLLPVLIEMDRFMFSVASVEFLGRQKWEKKGG